MARQGAETRLVAAMRKAGTARYGDRLVVVKYHGSGFSEAGVSDLLCVLDGVFVAVEVKAPESYGNNIERALTKGPTVKQMAFLDRVALAGGVAGVAATVQGYLALLRDAEQAAGRYTVTQQERTEL